MCFGDRLLVNLFLKPKYKMYLFKKDLQKARRATVKN